MSMATTLDINNTMYSDPVVKQYYGGTWSIDNVPIRQALKSKHKTCFVVNSSPSTHPGSHWTSVWIGEKKTGKREIEHFCSYGMKPPLHLHRLLVKERRKYKQNRKQLQKRTSILCGYYCMLYLLCKCRGISMKEFLNCFTNSPSINDAIVKLYF